MTKKQTSQPRIQSADISLNSYKSYPNKKNCEFVVKKKQFCHHRKISETSQQLSQKIAPCDKYFLYVETVDSCENMM